MYSLPAPLPRTAAPTQQKTTTAVFLGICCLGTFLILIGATIILALIPIYLSNRSVEKNPTTGTSKEVTIIADVGSGASRSIGGWRRRRQASDDLSEYVGGALGDTGKKMLEEKLVSNSSTDAVSGAKVSSATFGYKDQTTGKRSLLSKRQSRITNAVVIVIRFVYIYAPRCLARCQASSGSVLQAALTRTVPTFVFTNIEIILLGGSLRLISIKITAIVFISDILPGSSSVTVGTSPVTVTLTTTQSTTTASTLTTLTTTSTSTTTTTRSITTTTTAAPNTPRIG